MRIKEKMGRPLLFGLGSLSDFTAVLEFSARIVTRRGAISPDLQLYKYFSGRWNL